MQDLHCRYMSTITFDWNSLRYEQPYLGNFWRFHSFEQFTRSQHCWNKSPLNPPIETIHTVKYLQRLQNVSPLLKFLGEIYFQFPGCNLHQEGWQIIHKLENAPNKCFLRWKLVCAFFSDYDFTCPCWRQVSVLGVAYFSSLSEVSYNIC